MSRIKGIYEETRLIHRDLLFDILDLNSIKHIPMWRLSAGQKRQALVVLSFIGCPSILVLDKPFRGVDFVAKEKFRWVLNNLKMTSSVLATNDLGDAEQVCDNIGMLVNGRFVTYGPPEYIKYEYGSGSVVKVIVEKESDSEMVRQ
jgi:ABC-type multidrug transport system ATPase subunit